MTLLSTLVRAVRALHPGRRRGAGPLRPTGRAVQIRFFRPARFALRNLPGISTSFEMTLELLAMRVEDGHTSVEIHIRDHGLRIEAVLDGHVGHLVVYLGNNFFVPPELRRAGVASACIAAMRQAFQLAAYGDTRPEQPASLEGYFVGNGADWARAMCAGKLPTKAAPARIDPARLAASDQRVQLLVPPTEIDRGGRPG